MSPAGKESETESQLKTPIAKSPATSSPATKSPSAAWRVAILLVLAAAVALPVSLSQAVEDVSGAQVVPCPDGSNAECVPIGFMGDEGEMSKGQWLVSEGCVEFR